MIIDDQTIISGSANIGDRSQLGWRDSEVNIITKGGKKIKKSIGGQEIEVSEKAHQLRLDLWKWHFGLNPCDMEDPLNDQLLKVIQERTHVIVSFI